MADTPAYLSRDYVRLWDLVRQMRSELLDANLITQAEYAALLTEETADAPGQGSPSPRRLESYDEMRQRIHALSGVIDKFVASGIVLDDGAVDRVVAQKAATFTDDFEAANVERRRGLALDFARWMFRLGGSQCRANKEVTRG